MFPGDPTGVARRLFFLTMEETLVFVDEGFLKKLIEHFGDGKKLKFDKFDFAKTIAKKQGYFVNIYFIIHHPHFSQMIPQKMKQIEKEVMINL